MVVYKLVPFGGGSSELNPLIIDTEKGEVLVIGRNQTTGLKVDSQFFQHVSRSHVEISCKTGKIFATPTASQLGVVFINNVKQTSKTPVELKVGSTISLIGHLNHFNYRLEIDDSPMVDLTSSSSPILHPLKRSKSSKTQEIDMVEKQAAPKVPNLGAASSATVKELEEHSECSICLSPMAFAHNICPCGDSFCYECIADWSEKNSKCPFCQTPFDPKQLFHNRMLDNMIRELMKSTSEDGLREWDERVRRGKERKKALLGTGVAVAKADPPLSVQMQPPRFPLPHPPVRVAPVPAARVPFVPNPQLPPAAALFGAAAGSRVVVSPFQEQQKPAVQAAVPSITVERKNARRKRGLGGLVDLT